MATDRSSLCHRLAVPNVDTRQAALRELGQMPPEARAALRATEGRFAGWPAGALAACAFLSAKIWPQVLFRPVLADFTPEALSAPGPDGVPVGVWFWLGSMKRAIADKKHHYHENHYAFRQSLSLQWGEEPMAQAVRTVLASPLARGSGNLANFVRKAHSYEQEYRLRQVEGGDVRHIRSVLDDLAELTKLPDDEFVRSTHPLLATSRRGGVSAALIRRPTFWFEDASRHRFWWELINRQHPFRHENQARVLSHLIQAGFEPTSEEAALTRERWLGIDPKLDATLEALVLTESLPGKAPSARPRMRL